MKKSKTELLEHLREQFDFLQRSSAAFDAGHESEAKRLAVSVRVLLHDTTSSHSLLGLLQRKTSTLFASTPNPYGPGNILPENRLVHVAATLSTAGAASIKYRAVLDDLPPIPWDWMPFGTWWDGIVMRDASGISLSRKKLVLFLANKEGARTSIPNLTQHGNI